MIEKIWRWPLGVGAVVLGGWWLSRWAARAEREGLAGRDAWAADAIADALVEGGVHPRERLRAELSGPSTGGDAEVRAWIDAQGLRVALTYERTSSGATESLVIETLRGRRRVTRSRAWDELSSSVRGEFLSGRTTVVIDWRTPWSGWGAGA
jgi:hypothetical protein